MTRLLLLLPFLLFFSSTFSKSMVGEYTLTGTIYDKNSKLPITNSEFTINEDTVKTDSLGNYSTKIKWSTCDRGSLLYITICTHKNNNKIVIVNH